MRVDKALTFLLGNDALSTGMGKREGIEASQNIEREIFYSQYLQNCSKFKVYLAVSWQVSMTTDK